MALVINEILSRCKELQQILLIVGQKESSASHNVHCPKRNPALNAAQRNIQVDVGTFEHIRHCIIIINLSHAHNPGRRKLFVFRIQLYRIFFSDLTDQLRALHRSDLAVQHILCIHIGRRFHAVHVRYHRICLQHTFQHVLRQTVFHKIHPVNLHLRCHQPLQIALCIIIQSGFHAVIEVMCLRIHGTDKRNPGPVSALYFRRDAYCIKASDRRRQRKVIYGSDSF